MVQNAAQKPQSPPPPPPKPPAAQTTAPVQGPQAQAPAQGQAQSPAKAAPKPATQTGFSAQDGFEAQPRSAARPQPQAQGDTFEAAAVKPQISADAAAVQPTPKAADAQPTDTKPTDAKPTDTKPTDAKPTDAKPADAQATAATEPATAPDPNDPTAGMTDDQLKAYNELSPTDQARYDQLHQEAATNHQNAPAVDGGASLATPESSVAALRNLLTTGQIDDLLKVEDSLGGDKQAVSDLHELAFRGVLGAKDINGHTTLSTIANLADDKTKLLDGMDRQGLLRDVLHDLNHHEDVRQLDGSRNCSGGDAAWYMAVNDPAEYVREVSELAQHGEVSLEPALADRLRGMGIPIPESGTRTFEGTFDPKQNATAQLFGGGFTEAAQDEEGGEGWFSQIVDKIQQVMGVDEGVTGAQFAAELNEGWGGANWDTYALPPAGDTTVSPEVREQARTTTEDMLETASVRHPVMVNIDGHFVAVTHYDPKTGDLRYFDSNADPDQPKPRLTIDDVMERGSSVVYQSSNVHVDVPPELTEHPEWDDEGGGGPSSGGFGGSGGGSGGTRGGGQ